MFSSSTLTFAFPPVSRRSRRRYCGGCSWWWCGSPFMLASLPSPAKEPSKYTLASLSSNSFSPKSKLNDVQESSTSELAEEENNDDGGEFQVVTAVRTTYNDIVIIDSRESRMLLLDSSHNVHSIFNKGEKWTRSYWDEFASLPAVVPQGPIAILGLGGGTAAHLMLDLWPSLELEGWEIDEILIDKAREYLGLSDLEKHTHMGGILHVRIGDALSPLVNVPGGYAGIAIDLFSNGKVLPQLEEVATWLELSEKLKPHGRIMVNCGAADDGASFADSTWIQNSTIKALYQAFPGQVNWKKLSKAEGHNFLALTGPLPDLTAWSAVLPDRLSSAVKQWAPCLAP